MINDNENYTLDFEFSDLERNGIAECWTSREGLGNFINNYIKAMGVAKPGVTIVYMNAQAKISPPSGSGTMLNLYNMFYYYMHMMEE